MKFPLKHLKSESSAAARMTLTIQREWRACSKATAVMNELWVFVNTEATWANA